MMPMTTEVVNYEMNWAVVDKYALHEKMRPWISNIARNSLDEEADDLVSQILESLDNHGSAASVLKLIMSFRLVNEVESESLFRNMWEMLFSSIKFFEKIDRRKPLGVGIFNDTPKTKEEVLSLEINWVIFDQRDLRETMRPWIREEVMKLLKKEKASVVDQVVDSIKKQNRPSRMLEVLEPSWAHAETVVRILWRTLLILNCALIGVSSFLLFASYLNLLLSISKAFIFSFFETGFAAFPISSINPNTKLSNVEDMPTDDNLRQQNPVWDAEDSSDRVAGVIKRNRCYSYPSFWQQNRMLSFETLCEANRLGNAIPRNVENFYSYEVDWAVSDREELHNRLKPWIFREIMEFVRPEEAATSVVDSIVSGIKDHANAEDILELVRPSLGDTSATFVPDLWMKLIFAIQLAGTTGLDPFPDRVRERLAREKVKISQYGDSQAMPKTKEELFSCEIKWDVYEKHGLQKNMRKGIWIETLELVRQKQEAMPVDEEIMWNIFDYHVSASQREFNAQEEAVPVFEQIMLMLHKDRACPSKMLEYLGPILGSGSEKFVMRMWYAVICGVQLAESSVAEKCEGGSRVLLPVGNQDL
ncbi:hypothetical protein MKW92_050339 [Papaver armeniacum]|nr:hypothetical protein MKW92_050339 [Papaver armeniacum]